MNILISIAVLAVLLKLISWLFNPIRKWVLIYNNSEGKKKKWLIYQSLLTVAIVASIALIGWNFKSKPELLLKNRYIKFLFITGKGFNWVGVTSTLAIVSLTFTAWDSRRKLRADLVSKSRIQWMRDVRPLVSKFVVNARYYMFLHLQYQINTKKRNHNAIIKRSMVQNRITVTEMIEEVEKLNYELQQTKKYINEKFVETENLYTQIKLNLPKDLSGDNQKLLDPIETVWAEIYEIQSTFKTIGDDLDKRNEFNEKVMLELDSVIEAGRNFFKQEWEKAKQGK